MRWKEEYIEMHGEKGYIKELKRRQAWNDAHPETVKRQHHEQNRKGGKYYENAQKYNHSGLRKERNVVRYRHSRRWQQYKKIIAPDSQIHHEWIMGTAKYRGIALVEKDQHQHGIIDVIQILDGTITVLTERETKSIYIS